MNPLLARFSPMLFWDTDREKVDVRANARWLVVRVLEYGTFDDWRLLRRLYSRDEIVGACCSARSLSRPSVAFVSARFHVPEEDFRCMKAM